MRLNDDLSASVLVHADALDWMPSPAAGVERRMLFRVGAERARATSIVRYAPNSRFAPHVHAGGEEFLVLDGTFQDETGDHPRGSYCRNPPGSAHAPGSATGCTIFVRLWQFAAGDQERVFRRPGEGRPGPARAGVSSSLTLFEGRDERVVSENWSPGAEVGIGNLQGLELLVLSGTLSLDGRALDCWDWLRLPAGRPFRARAGREGARVWYKSAPLVHADACALEGA